jgi:hypothetical protein
MTHQDPWTIRDSDFPSSSPIAERLKFLIRYAMLAPSSHNTQPWKFRIVGDHVDVFMDDKRWLKVADDDQRELHISIGCALENLVIAADYFTLGYHTHYLPDPDNPMHAATVRFQSGNSRPDQQLASLFPMMTVRHTNHREYENRPIPMDILEQLQSIGSEAGMTTYLTNDAELKRKIDTLMMRADAIEFADPAFREELGYWIGQGVFGTSWLMSKIGQFAVTYLNLGATTAKKDTAVLMSSPVLGLISSQNNDRLTQIHVGQVYQRLSLLAASFGIWCQPMSQILQIDELKQQVARLQPEPTLIPQHPFRMGYAEPEAQHTPRRQLDEVLL